MVGDGICGFCREEPKNDLYKRTFLDGSAGRVLAVTPDDLSSILRPLTVEGNQLSKVVSDYTCAVDACSPQ